MDKKLSQSEGEQQRSLLEELEVMRYMIGEYRLTYNFGDAPKITYANFINTYLNGMNIELKDYLQALANDPNHEVLPSDFLKEATQKSYWFQNDRLEQDMYRLKDKPLSSIGLKIIIEGTEYTNSLQIYEEIEERTEQLIALLKEIEAS